MINYHIETEREDGDQRKRNVKDFMAAFEYGAHIKLCLMQISHLQKLDL